MIVVIQCAAGKRANSGYLRTAEGKPVVFVAHPEAAPPRDNFVYARPDDDMGNGQTWRKKLLDYNRSAGANPLALRPAFQLYANDTYRALVEKFSSKNVFILSAGWGLIGADFLTPYYDITFSPAAEFYKRRSKRDRYRDFTMLDAKEDEILFFGGKDYVPLFDALTKHLRCQRTIFFNSGSHPDVVGCSLQRYQTSTRTNWHYECARDFLSKH